jgi:hypothetical protein
MFRIVVTDRSEAKIAGDRCISNMFTTAMSGRNPLTARRTVAAAAGFTICRNACAAARVAPKAT